jgi:hypothetical protein
MADKEKRLAKKAENLKTKIEKADTAEHEAYNPKEGKKKNYKKADRKRKKSNRLTNRRNRTMAELGAAASSKSKSKNPY